MNALKLVFSSTREERLLNNYLLRRCCLRPSTSRTSICNQPGGDHWEVACMKLQRLSQVFLVSCSLPVAVHLCPAEVRNCRQPARLQRASPLNAGLASADETSPAKVVSEAGRKRKGSQAAFTPRKLHSAVQRIAPHLKVNHTALRTCRLDGH